MKENRTKRVTFRVTELAVGIDKTVCRKGDAVEVTFRADPEDQVLGWLVQDPKDFWRNAGYFGAEDAAAGKVTIPVELAAGEYCVYIMAEGAYGRYRSAGVAFRVEE